MPPDIKVRGLQAMDSSAAAAINDFCVADLHLRIVFCDTRINNMALIKSFEPFREKVSDGSKLFTLTVDDGLQPVREGAERIGTFDTGNGDTIVDVLPGGGYQYIIKDIRGHGCCLLQTDRDFCRCRCALNGSRNMRSFGLLNALMLVFAFAGSRFRALLIHASLVRCNGRGYAFIAKSGTGKSTQVGLWLRHIPGCDLMNDDNPIVRITDGGTFIYGSPWSGKTPCYRNVKAPLGAVTRIERAKENSIERLSPTAAFASMLPSCSTMKWSKDIFDNICNSITGIIETTGMFTLHCLPDKDSAILCHKTISK